MDPVSRNRKEAHFAAQKTRARAELELYFMLFDSCMPRLSPNAWKVVCYVAGQHLRVHSEWLDRKLDAALSALGRDLDAIGNIDSLGESGERPYRGDGCWPGTSGRANQAGSQ